VTAPSINRLERLARLGRVTDALDVRSNVVGPVRFAGATFHAGVTVDQEPRGQRGRSYRSARRRTPAVHDGRGDAPQACTLPGIMACLTTTRARLARPHERRQARPTATVFGYGRSCQTAAQSVTVRTVGGGFNHSQSSASVWDLRRGCSARRLLHPPASPSATSSRRLGLGVVG
jgi:hypothetical protein